jgi:hypothetical protein
MTIVLQFYPNGEFTQGISAPPPKKRRDKPAPKNAEITADIKEAYLRWEQWARENGHSTNLYVPGQEFRNQRGDTYTYLCHDSDGHHFALEAEEGCYPDVIINEPIGQMVARWELIPLVHLSLESSPVPLKSRKTLEKMSAAMGRNIRNAVYLLETDYGKDCLSFLTLTLPNLSQEDLGKVCQAWDRMTDQILKWIRKRLQAKGVEFEYVYCTEIQPKRLQKRHEYSPHLHLVFRGRHGKKSPWIITPKRVRQAWANIIAGVCGHAQFTTCALENLQRIKYSAQRYLSKYLSKGKNCLPPNDAENQEIRLHTQWGGMARSLSRRIKRGITRLTSSGRNGELVVSFLRRVGEMVQHGVLRYWKKIDVCLRPPTGDSPGKYLFCGVGCLSSPAYEGGLLRCYEFLRQESPV